MLNALTFDVEDYYQVQAFAEVVRPSEWNRYPARVEQNTQRLLEILATHNVHATFFVVGWVAERCPRLVAEIAKAGHEIGSHGYAHQMVGREGADAFRRDLIRSKSVLEDQVGLPIRCYRAPSYSITADTLWALEILAENGFTLDSSIFPIVHDHYGIPDAPRFPHYKSLLDGKSIAEFPPSTVRMCGVNLPVAGGGYLRLMPYAATARAIRAINTHEMQPAMVYVHPWEIDPEQPRIPAGWRSRFRHYTNLRSTERKLRALLDDFAWGRMSEVFSAALKGGEFGGEVANV